MKTDISEVTKHAGGRGLFTLEVGDLECHIGDAVATKLVRMQVDWNTLTMTFNTAGTTMTLQGDPSLSKTPVSLKMM